MTDLDRLIEAVARAMCAADGRDPDGEDVMLICDAENRPLPLWQYYADMARAAILAVLKGIREPSEAQYQVVEAAGTVTTLSYGEAYRAMIDRLIQDFAPEGNRHG